MKLHATLLCVLAFIQASVLSGQAVLTVAEAVGLLESPSIEAFARTAKGYGFKFVRKVPGEFADAQHYERTAPGTQQAEVLLYTNYGAGEAKLYYQHDRADMLEGAQAYALSNGYKVNSICPAKEGWTATCWGGHNRTLRVKSKKDDQARAYELYVDKYE